MSNPIFDRIQNEITENNVVLYMKGTPDFPQCGFSAMASHILKSLGVTYKGVDVLADDTIRQGIKDFANWPTSPQLYIKGEFVGGCDIMKEMAQNGELLQMMKDKGVPTAA
jgi:monothiol glutaredoxin